MNKARHGTIRGKTFQLDEAHGLVEGQAVEIQMKAVSSSQTWGNGIRNSAGGWAIYPELDMILKTIYQERKLERLSQMDHE